MLSTSVLTGSPQEQSSVTLNFPNEKSPHNAVSHQKDSLTTCTPVQCCFGLASVFWHCWLGIRESIRPVENWGRDEVLKWLSVWSKVQMICIWSTSCHCHYVISCIIKIQIALTFLVPAYPFCSGREAIKWVWTSVLRLCLNYGQFDCVRAYFCVFVYFFVVIIYIIGYCRFGC